MNKLFSITLILALSSFACNAQILNKIKIPKTTSSVTSLSETDIINGLKEALTKSSKIASDALNKTDGYNGNPLIRIPFPTELTKMETTLRELGLGKEVDKFVLSLNRSAEQAAVEAAPIFANAITQMNFTDATSILKGSDTAATAYLRKVTYSPLTTAFTPHIKNALDKNFVASQWANLSGIYNKMPTTKTKVNTDIVAFTTGKALQGLFTEVAGEEAKIRKDPLAQTSDLLKKVFGSQSK